MNSIRSPFVTFVLLGLLALLPLGIYAGSAWLNPTPAPRVYAARIAGEVDRLLQLRLSETFTVAAFPSFRAFAASLPPERPQRMTVAMNELQAWVAADKQLREAFIVDSQGAPIVATGTAMKSGWGARTFVREALQGHLDVSPISREGNEFSQYYAAPVLDNRGEVAGALVARVAAQELWSVVNAGSDLSEGTYAVLVDENGVRLADAGQATSILSALGPLDAERQARIVREQTYGLQALAPQSGPHVHAEALVVAKNAGVIQASDLGVPTVGIAPCSVKPWTVLLVSSGPSFSSFADRLAIPFLFGLAGAALLAVWVGRLGISTEDRGRMANEQ